MDQKKNRPDPHFYVAHPKDLEELTEDVMRAVDAIKSSPDKLRACIEASELPSFLR